MRDQRPPSRTRTPCSEGHHSMSHCILETPCQADESRHTKQTQLVTLDAVLVSVTIHTSAGIDALLDIAAVEEVLVEVVECPAKCFQRAQRRRLLGKRVLVIVLYRNVDELCRKGCELVVVQTNAQGTPLLFRSRASHKNQTCVSVPTSVGISVRCCVHRFLQVNGSCRAA